MPYWGEGPFRSLFKRKVMTIPKPSQLDTKTRILDAAERLFAMGGFRGTSIKQLAREAGVNQAAVNYHFGSKAALIEKAIIRRLKPINRQQRQRLETLLQDVARGGGRPPVKDVLRAFIEPAFAIEPAKRKNSCLLAMEWVAFSEPEPSIRSAFFRQLSPSFALFLRVMKEALPDLPEEDLLARIHFTIGAMRHCLLLNKADFLSPDFPAQMNDHKPTTSQLLDFVTDGMLAPARQTQSARPM